ncbi:PadR family transcriptional regulator [Deinococcus roseus]|nr:PadR family transcriptional regulator [Deinococcus roseus]
MKDASLGPSSYAVLGMVNNCGAATSYDIKRQIDQSVGNFWTFARSQLYAEPQRLAELGLLQEEQEDFGRRRRLFQLTEQGKQVLEAWLSDPGTPTTELRDMGLMKLYFSKGRPTEAIRTLARQQQEVHRTKLAEYQEMHRQLSLIPEATFGLASLRLGCLFEESTIQFWEEIEQNPPALPQKPERPLEVQEG